MKIAFTIATANYLAQSKTLAGSFLAHHPDHAFFIVLLDKPDGIDRALFHGIHLVAVEELHIDGFDEMLDRYTIFELSNALKPFCALYFLEQEEVQSILYFDSDIFVYRNLAHLYDLLVDHDIILTPHVLHPLPDDGLLLDETAFLNAGIYNGGFFALKRSPGVPDFLLWWKERMKTKCLVQLENGLFVDQIWLNLVPLYFKGVKILDHLGYNVAFWNLHERALTPGAGGSVWVNGDTALYFFHFSGYNVDQPETVSRYQNRISFESRPDAAPLYRQYAADVNNNGYEAFSRMECFYVLEKKLRTKLPEEEIPPPPEPVEIAEEKPLTTWQKIAFRCSRSLRMLVKGY